MVRFFIMLEKANSKPFSNSTMPCSKYSTQLNLSKCSISNVNSSEDAGDSAGEEQLKRWPPTTAVIDRLVLKLKDKDGDVEAKWEKIILNFKKELDAEEQLKAQLTSDLVNVSGGGSRSGGGGAIGRRDTTVRAKFSVPLSRREMEKDFEDMGERRLPRKPKKRPKSVQNQLDTLFPGLWLTEINADLYRVSDTKKR